MPDPLPLVPTATVLGHYVANHWYWPNIIITVVAEKVDRGRSKRWSWWTRFEVANTLAKLQSDTSEINLPSQPKIKMNCMDPEMLGLLNTCVVRLHP